MLIENMKMAINSLRANKLRSILTMLGIIIGIGSVISIVSLGDTMRKVFSDIYKNVGETQAVIMLSYTVDEVRSSDSFSLDDIDKLKQIFGDRLAYIDAGSQSRVDVKIGRKKQKADLSGVDYNYETVQPVNMLSGRYLSKKDVQETRNVAMLKDSTARLFFGTENAVGKTFRAEVGGENRTFQVIGVYHRDESAIQKVLTQTNDSIGEVIIPWTILAKEGDELSMLRYFGRLGMNKSEMDQLNTEIKGYFSRTKNRNPEDWQIISLKTQMGQVDSVMAGISAAVGGIAAISLLVGGIGIMNIMLVSVTERTREIGIRKALGASTKDILIQFLTESALLSALGGLIGVLLAIGLVSLGGAIFHLQVVIKPIIIVIAVAFSAVVGVFFGLYPANRAANEDPIVALRYE
ncbi:efflux ABC transporter, permease protein [Oribacterium sp. oral taxon 078 str. F0263]|uniref:ABC transporter permease n=1 Tax=Oribacterium sp. oral taxon 078 TaxID=652706 RepID=UPI0003ADCC8F|nr:ABC transporter permease [Oribacterium sp. oral taxon 078]ERL22926.1 efflux ABC transporter, permease protein [Oribacterium sp. oral taxon 078 str. F0263]